MQICLNGITYAKLYIIYDSVIDFLNKNNRFTSHRNPMKNDMSYFIINIDFYKIVLIFLAYEMLTISMKYEVLHACF